MSKTRLKKSDPVTPSTLKNINSVIFRGHGTYATFVRNPKNENKWRGGEARSEVFNYLADKKTPYTLSTKEVVSRILKLQKITGISIYLEN